MLGLGKDKGPLYGALIDVGSGTIGVAIVASQLENKLPTILYMDRINMRVGKHTGLSNESIRRVREMLLAASLSLSQDGYAALRAVDPHAKITELCITVSSPWSFTVSHQVEYRDDEPFRISQSILADLINSAESEILAGIREGKKMKEEGFTIVERATTNITVNEYPVKDPFHVEGTVLNLSHIAGLVPTTIMDSVHEIQDKLFPDTRIHAHTAMLVMYSVVSDLFPRIHSFGIINVTAEATEFGIIEDNLLIENSFIDEGTNSFLQELMEKTGRPLADIETSLRSYGNTVTPEDADIKSASDAYRKKVSGGILKILEKRAFPNRVIITAHAPFSDLFRAAIGDAVRSAIDKKVNILSIDKHLIDEIANHTGTDVYLALGARFFHKLHEKDGHD